METLIRIAGSLVLIAASMAVITFCIWVCVVSFRAIGWHLARLWFKRTERIEACLDPADSVVRLMLRRHGEQPFDRGALFYRKQYEFLHEVAGRPFPEGYVTIADDPTPKEPHDD